MFYECSSLEAPILDIPSHQYGPMLGFGNFTLLEPLRRFQWAGYSWRGVVVPRAYKQPIAALGQDEDRIQVPAGSWLLGFSAGSAQAAGFRFSIYDFGTKDYALSEYWDSNAAGAQDNTDTDAAIPHILPEPYYIVTPGQLQIKVVNSASVANDMQLLLHFAIPIDRNAKGILS